MKFWVLLIAALACGILIGWVDSLPSWDDTGITVAAILLTTAVLGALMPSRAWLWALIVGGCIFLVNAVLNGNYEAIPALVIAFAGAYLGAVLRRGLGPTDGTSASH